MKHVDAPLVPMLLLCFLACSQPTAETKTTANRESPVTRAIIVISDVPGSRIPIDARVSQIESRIETLSDIELGGIAGLGGEAITVGLDRERAAALGIDSQTVAARVAALSIDELKDSTLPTRAGGQVPLSAIATLSVRAAPDCTDGEKRVVLLRLELRAPGLALTALRERLQPGQGIALTTASAVAFGCTFEHVVIE